MCRLGRIKHHRHLHRLRQVSLHMRHLEMKQLEMKQQVSRHMTHLHMKQLHMKQLQMKQLEMKGCEMEMKGCQMMGCLHRDHLQHRSTRLFLLRHLHMLKGRCKWREMDHLRDHKTLRD